MINNMERVDIYFYPVIDLDLVIKLENMKTEMTLLLKYQKIIIKEIQEKKNLVKKEYKNQRNQIKRKMQKLLY